MHLISIVFDRNFRTTFVRGLTAFWVKEPSANVTVNNSTDSTDEDTSTVTKSSCFHITFLER